MSWLTNIGLLLDLIGAILITVPDIPWSRAQRFVYRHSPLVKHYQAITKMATFIRNVILPNPATIFDQNQESDLPFEPSVKTIRVLYGVLRNHDFRTGCDVDDRIESVIIKDEIIKFIFEEKTNFGIPVENGLNRIRMAKDGFLPQYYTRKGACFLICGFSLQLLDNIIL